MIKKKFIKKECTNLIIGFVANIENKLKMITKIYKN